MIKCEFTKDFIIKSIPAQYKRLLEEISVLVIYDDRIKAKARLKSTGEFFHDYIRIDDITQIRREFILNEILK